MKKSYSYNENNENNNRYKTLSQSYESGSQLSTISDTSL